MDDAGCLELSKLLHDHFLRRVRDGPPQDSESARTFSSMEMPQNNRLPFPTDYILRRLDRATEEPLRLADSRSSFHIG